MGKGLRGASKSGKGTGVPSVGAKVSKSGVSGTNRSPSMPGGNYPAKTVRGPRG